MTLRSSGTLDVVQRIQRHPEVCEYACVGMSRVYSCLVSVTSSERGVDGWRKRKLVMLYRVVLIKLPAAFILKFQLLHGVL